MPRHAIHDHVVRAPLRAFVLIVAALATLIAAGGGPAVSAEQLAAAPVTPRADAPAAQSTAAPAPENTKQHIESLIRQLGDAHYATRRAAAAELQQIGAEAFDLLHEATTDSDPEVAASARYLIRRIAVRWVRGEDSPAVRALLRDYDTQPDNMRLRRVATLARLDHGDGVAGLCRVARFDRSPIVSRMAALAVIRPNDEEETALPVDPEVVERELGNSTRASADWLRRYLVQLRDPAAAVAYWQTLIDEEFARLQAHAPDTSAAIVTGLLWNLAELYRQLENRPALFGVVDRMMLVDPDETDATSIRLLTWLYEKQTWGVLDDFLAKHLPRIEQSKRPLYYAAVARAKQGKAEEANQLAEKASQIDPQAPLESFLTAKDMEERRQFEWAVREYRRSFADERVNTQEEILARIYLARLLHDHQQDAEAVEVIAPLERAIKNDGQVGQLYAELIRFYGDQNRLDVPSVEQVSARHRFYKACQLHAEKNWAAERTELDAAIKFDPTDADVLIAMYRSPEADPTWRNAVKTRIADLANRFQQQIDENPNDPAGYNQWAWLISNTEGDFTKAVRYSHRSLELIPPTAAKSAGGSFLDTLGRCYFAAGDLENALKYQRQALERVDYMQVMHRQLAEFEKAQQEKK